MIKILYHDRKKEFGIGENLEYETSFDENLINSADYWVGITDLDQIYDVFKNSRDFYETREGIFESEGITAYLADQNTAPNGSPAVAYTIESEVSNENTLREFVNGILYSSDDVDEEFASEIRQTIRSIKHPVTDGGIMANIDHGGGEVQPAFQRGTKEERGIPIGGFPHTVENAEETENQYFMGKMPY